MAKKRIKNRCGECVHCTPVTKFHTLNVYGEPTLGYCPYWMESKCILLSQAACETNFELKVLINDGQGIEHSTQGNGEGAGKAVV